MPDRNVHHRQHDHFGEDSDLYVGIDEAIGPWEAMTPVKYVLQDMYSRITVLDSNSHHLGYFTIDSWVLAPGGTVGTGNIRSVFFIDQIVRQTMSGSFTIYCLVAKGGNFTIDSWIRPGGSFSIDMFVV